MEAVVTTAWRAAVARTARDGRIAGWRCNSISEGKTILEVKRIICYGDGDFFFRKKEKCRGKGCGQGREGRSMTRRC